MIVQPATWACSAASPGLPRSGKTSKPRVLRGSGWIGCMHRLASTFMPALLRRSASVSWQSSSTCDARAPSSFPNGSAVPPSMAPRRGALLHAAETLPRAGCLHQQHAHDLPGRRSTHHRGSACCPCMSQALMLVGGARCSRRRSRPCWGIRQPQRSRRAPGCTGLRDGGMRWAILLRAC